MPRFCLTFLVFLFVFGCTGESRFEDKEPQIQKENSAKSGGISTATRAVGFRFEIPGVGGPRPSGFSMISESGKVDFELLAKQKVKEAHLSEEQRKRFVDAVYGDNPNFSGAACYDPHHIFIFYDAAEEIVNVVEVCFACTKIGASPEIPESQWWKHDFRELAKLCDEIGIGMGNRSAGEYIQLLDDREGL